MTKTWFLLEKCLPFSKRPKMKSFTVKVKELSFPLFTETSFVHTLLSFLKSLVLERKAMRKVVFVKNQNTVNFSKTEKKFTFLLFPFSRNDSRVEFFFFLNNLNYYVFTSRSFTLSRKRLFGAVWSIFRSKRSGFTHNRECCV